MFGLARPVPVDLLLRIGARLGAPIRRIMRCVVILGYILARALSTTARQAVLIARNDRGILTVRTF